MLVAVVNVILASVVVDDVNGDGNLQQFSDETKARTNKQTKTKGKKIQTIITFTSNSLTTNKQLTHSLTFLKTARNRLLLFTNKIA